MELTEGLRLEVRSGGKVLEMYKDPDAQKHDEESDETIHYIEAITGAKFQVEVTLDRSFEWENPAEAHAVRVKVHFDGSESGWGIDIPMLECPPCVLVFDKMCRRCQSTQQWQQGYTSFGSLELSMMPEARWQVYS